MQSRRELDGHKAELLFWCLCHIRSAVFLLLSHPTCQQAAYVKQGHDAKREYGQWGGQFQFFEVQICTSTTPQGFTSFRSQTRMSSATCRKLASRWVRALQVLPGFCSHPQQGEFLCSSAGGKRLNLLAVGRGLSGTGPGFAV